MKEKSKLPNTDSLDFTVASQRAFRRVIEATEFNHEDSATIYKYLTESLSIFSFGDFLRRYIYKKQQITDSFATVGLDEYQKIIIEAFEKNKTPKAFNEVETKWSTITRNWLTQVTVSRSVVFLLGFGLKMNPDEVSALLTKALNERDFDFRNPLEVIYWYCYHNNYDFAKMLELKQAYENFTEKDAIVNLESTARLRNKISDVQSEADLFTFLKEIKRENGYRLISYTAEKYFKDLYDQCRSIIAGFYNEDEKELETGRVWALDEINAGDVEKVLCCGTPINQSGNLERISSSAFVNFFRNKRFTRNHIREILTKEIEVDRFDLITLNFFIYSQKEEFANDNKGRYRAFVKSTNKILTDCYMGELYHVNPYECFIMMCIMTDAPLGTYADVWEISFFGES